MLLAAASARAQDVGTLWLTMPRAMTQYITREQRREMLRNYSSGEDTAVTNELHGQSGIDTLAADYGRFRLSSARSLQLVRLPVEEGDSIVCAIDLYRVPAAMSVVAFYLADWTPMEDVRVPDFGVAELTARPDSMSVDEFDELCKWFDPQLVATEFDPAAGLFVVSLSAPFSVSQEKEKIESIIRKRFLKWSDNQLKDVTNMLNSFD